MKIQVKENDFDRPRVPAGTYEATLIEVHTAKMRAKSFDGKPAKGDADGMQEVLWWSFKLYAYPIVKGVQQSADWVVLEGMSSLATGKKSKLRRWAGALGGVLTTGMEFDLDTLFGNKAMITVEDSADDDGNITSKIGEVLPKAGSAPVPPPAGGDDDLV